MKALSLKQPWANMIAWGAKSIETRTWRTNYRGQLLILASKNVDRQEEGFATLFDTEPRGVALAVVELYACEPMVPEDRAGACFPCEPGRYSWRLRNIHRIKEPFPVRGQLGLFEVDVPEFIDAVLVEGRHD